MVKMVEKIILNKKSNICINAALLFEMGLEKFCDSVVIIKASFFNIIKRARKRDGYSIWRILRILKRQKVYQYANKKMRNVDIFYVRNKKNINIFREELLFELKKRELL
jgi:dephospho-CoA kinase